MSIEDKIGRLRRAMYSRKVAPTFGEEERHTLPRQVIDTPEDWAKPGDQTATSGTMVAPRAIRYTRTALWWLLGLAVIFFLASAAAFAWYFVGGFGTDVRGNNIDIVIKGPLSVIGGEPAELQVMITNRNKAPLEFADLVVDYPTGTRSVTDLATALPSQRISLGTIEAGGTREGTVNAILVGQGGTTAVIKVSLEYQVEGTTAIFTTSEEYEFIFASSPVAIAIEGNTEVIPGQPVTITATVSANANTVLKDVLLQLEPPFGFALSSASPIPAQQNLWTLGDLRPGDTRVIALQGVMKGQPGDERVFRFKVGTKQSPGSSTVEVPLVEFTHQVTIAQPFIGLSVGVNGNTNPGTAIVRPGEQVTITINWKNELTTAITNAVFVASLDGFPIAGDTVQTTDGFYRSVDNTVGWDSSTSRGALASLAPGGSGSVGFSFTVPSDIDLSRVRNPSLNISIHAAGDRSDQNAVPQNLRSSVVRTIKVETTPTALSQGFYHTNPFGASGSVPPKVNTETTYAILWSAGNSTNPIGKATITAQLPPYVRWTGVFAPGTEKLTFDQKTGKVTWDIGSLPAGVGGAGGAQAKQVAFEVALTPSTSQVGQQPALILNQVFTGIDTFTNTSVSRTMPDTTTYQINDPGFVASEAKVVQ